MSIIKFSVETSHLGCGAWVLSMMSRTSDVSSALLRGLDYCTNKVYASTRTADTTMNTWKAIR